MLGALFGGAKAVAEPIEAIGNVVDKLFTSDGEKLDKETALHRVQQRPSLAQTEINKVEARHRSIWTSGWRPGVGWFCVVALTYSFILRDMILWAMALWAPDIPPPPAVQTDLILELVLGMLGLGALRTVEKLNGRAK